MLIYIKPFCNMNYKLDKEYIVKVIGHITPRLFCAINDPSTYCVLALPAR